MGATPNDCVRPSSGCICYVSPILTTLKTVRYTKHTCNLAELHVLARNL